MTLPSYTKTKRKQNYETLPKGAYVLVIKEVEQCKNKSGIGEHLKIRFDIAEGEYAGFFGKQYEARKKESEDAKWPNDGIFILSVPERASKQFVWDNWNTFFSDLEDSNNGFAFNGDSPAMLRGKLIGGKFHIEQSEFNGQIYDHTKMRWSCVADDVRNGKAGRLPQDKLIMPQPVISEDDDFMNIPEGSDEENPFA